MQMSFDEDAVNTNPDPEHHQGVFSSNEAGDPMGFGSMPPLSREVPPAYGGWDDNRTEIISNSGSTDWIHRDPQLPPPLPIEPDDLARAARTGPDRIASTFADRPRRMAACHSVSGDFGGQLEKWLSREAPQLLSRQDSGQPPLSSVLLVKYYDVHDRLGVFDGHDGDHLGDLQLSLEPGSEFADLCVSSRFQTVYLADQTNSRLYAVDLSGQLRFTVAKRISSPQAVCVDDQRSLVFVCQRKKVRVFQQQQQQKKKSLRLRYLRGIKSPGFKNLTSAASRDGRLWLADSQSDLLFVYTAGADGEIDLAFAIELQNPLCISLDASGCAFVASGEPLHRITVYGPDGSEVGCFGGWGAKPCRMKLPVGVCAYQLSHLVDKRMVIVSCFADHNYRMYALKSLDTSVI